MRTLNFIYELHIYEEAKILRYPWYVLGAQVGVDVMLMTQDLFLLPGECRLDRHRNVRTRN